MDAKILGPVVIIGYATTNSRFEFATNQLTWAKAHKVPEKNPGKMISG